MNRESLITAAVLGTILLSWIVFLVRNRQRPFLLSDVYAMFFGMSGLGVFAKGLMMLFEGKAPLGPIILSLTGLALFGACLIIKWLLAQLASFESSRPRQTDAS